MNEINISSMIQIEQKEYNNIKTKEYKNSTSNKGWEEIVKKEEKVIYRINNKEYTVISKTNENSLRREKLIELIVNYAIRELKQTER